MSAPAARGGGKGRGGKGGKDGRGRPEPREEPADLPPSTAPARTTADGGSGKDGLEEAVQRMEISGGEDFVELAKSMHALLKAETASHEALSRRVRTSPLADSGSVQSGNLCVSNAAGWRAGGCAICGDERADRPETAQ